MAVLGREHIEQRPKWAERKGLRRWRNAPEAARREFDIDITWEETLCRFFADPPAKSVLVTDRVPLKVCACLLDCLNRPSGFSRTTSRRTTSSTRRTRSEAQTSELQSLMRISYAVFCL